MRIGYALSSEEHAPADLVRYARMAEDAGFEFASISDHFHPWIDQQGESAFVWGVLGAIAQRTDRLRVGTGVTCPLIRIHPAIIAQAAATTACLMPGRFFLGVGTGEALNEHIFGDRWPPIDVRLAMLEEAIEVIRYLWTGGQCTHRGPYYTVEDARIYSLPEQLPPVYVAASGTAAAGLAGRTGDGLISTAPDREIVGTFHDAGGRGKPALGQVTVCFEPDGDSARKTATTWWPTSAMKGQLGQELAVPAYFEQVAQMVGPDDVADGIVCGPDVDRHVEALREFERAGFDHVYVHQVGPNQEAFFRYYADEVLPRVRS